MKTRSNRIWRLIYKLHRYLGLCSALVLIMLAVTGIMLNHTEELQLDQQKVQSTALIDYYGIQAPEPTSFAVGQNRLTQLGTLLFFNNTLILTTPETLTGAIHHPQFIVAALTQSLLLLSNDGEIIEQLPQPGLQRLALLENSRIVIATEQGLSYSDDDLLSWQPYPQALDQWSRPSSLDTVQTDQLKQQFLTQILPWERVLLDLHSGRLFGKAGVFIVDLSGIFLLFLAISGCAVWIKHRIRQWYHRHHR